MKEGEKIKDLFAKLKDLLTMGSGTIISSVIYGIFWFYMAGLLGTGNYGQVNYLISISMIAISVSSLGSDNILLVYITKDTKLIPAILFITIISSFIASIILFLIFHNMAMSLFLIGSVLFYLVTNLLLGKKKYKNFSFYSISQRIILIPLSIGLYYLMGVDGVILGMALASFVFSYILYNEFRKTPINLSLLRTHSNFIGNSYLFSLSKTAASYIDRVIVFPMFGFSLLGNYALGLQFLVILGLVPQIVYQYLVPYEAAGKSNRNIKIGTIVASVAVAILSITLAPIMIPYFFPKFSETVEIVQIMSLAIIPLAVSITYISKFIGNGKIMIVTIGCVIYVITQIIAIFVFGKMFGINGAGLALVLAAFIESVYLIIVNKLTNR
jgi:O-antigen/teichoic acid export membrane protein